jgi:hypothetical protein
MPRRAFACPVKSYLVHILVRLGSTTTLHRRCPFSDIGIMNDSTIVVAGATGNLGRRITRALLERRASVKALVRQGTARDAERAGLGFAPSLPSPFCSNTSS